MNYSIKGLYLVTPDIDDTDHLCRQVSEALQGGIQCLQYRHKTASETLRHQQASALLTLCRAAGVPLIINDHLALAKALDADGVHVGQHDSAVAEARAVLGPEKWVGASCYNQLALAQQAAAAGASYLAFGACYPSSTKPHAPRATAELFRQARSQLSLPLVAIGGITLEHAPALLQAGADALAVISDVFKAKDVAARCQQYQALLQAPTPL